MQKRAPALNLANRHFEIQPGFRIKCLRPAEGNERRILSLKKARIYHNDQVQRRVFTPDEDELEPDEYPPTETKNPNRKV